MLVVQLCLGVADHAVDSITKTLAFMEFKGASNQPRYWLTRVLEVGVGSQAEANLIAGVHRQDASAAGAGEGALVAAGVGPVDGRAITDICGWVG